eukprot:scaffold41893_cov20-Tisochrysis_lutea.AAC.3
MGNLLVGVSLPVLISSLAHVDQADSRAWRPKLRRPGTSEHFSLNTAISSLCGSISSSRSCKPTSTESRPSCTAHSPLGRSTTTESPLPMPNAWSPRPSLTRRFSCA